MQAYIDYLKSNFEDVNIIFIDFMDLEFEEIKEYHTLFYTSAETVENFKVLW